MRKSLGNAIFLSDASEVVVEKVMGMYTDPGHVRAADPGVVEGNPAFRYLDAFDVGVELLDDFLRPIRDRRSEFARDPEAVMTMLKEGTTRGRHIVSSVLTEVRSARRLDYY